MVFSQDITPQKMRAVLGHFATGLTVVTSAGEEGPMGFTCQSFTSLSLEPPLISINPTKGSSTWPKIREIGRFAVNILPAGTEELALSFSKKGVDRFADVPWRASAAGNPHLNAALAWVDCELEAEHEAGDHTIAIGRVRHLEAAEAGHSPLLFFRGSFAALLLDSGIAPLAARQRHEPAKDSERNVLSA
ncbi:flavin reductase family protein [Psychromicrobium sp. YIM B11713]|uniref:flavin reductase family protein n=1 Tax=Psychromicrobium sp. YIM B11713 TaxID=3145233 RepID=UPI00374FA806